MQSWPPGGLDDACAALGLEVDLVSLVCSDRDLGSAPFAMALHPPRHH